VEEICAVVVVPIKLPEEAPILVDVGVVHLVVEGT
jgi:hypothetical protein